MKRLPLLVTIAGVSYLTGGLGVKYCSPENLWQGFNFLQDAGSALLAFLGVKNIGKIRAILKLLTDADEAADAPSRGPVMTPVVPARSVSPPTVKLI